MDNSNLTIAAGGTKHLTDGQWVVYINKITQIREIPNSNIGPGEKYKKFSVDGFAMEYSFEGFALKHNGLIDNVYDTKNEAKKAKAQRKKEVLKEQKAASRVYL